MFAKSNLTISLCVTYALFVYSPSVDAAVRYVKASAPAGGNGQSWASAHRHLQDALVGAPSGTHIWVAVGTYKADESSASPAGSGNRLATFQLISGVEVYGGFAGTETSLAQRAELFDQTILHGDLLGQDDPTYFFNHYDNSYHIVTGSGTNATAILDGFTLTHGGADGTVDLGRGAGMFNYLGSPTVRNCRFTANYAVLVGGGMYNSYSNPLVIDCTFSGNRADGGSGMSNSLLSSPEVRSCLFVQNIRYGNAGNGNGGGMFNQGGASPTVVDCEFRGNSATDGGGMANISADATIINCRFIDNQGVYSGGGLFQNLGSYTTVTNCTFIGNTAVYGGAMRNSNVTPTITNSTFYGNTATTNGGGIYNNGSSGWLEVMNSIVWGNGPNQIVDANLAPTTVYDSNIQGGWSGAGSGNMNVNPQFVNAAGDDLHLSSTSPCLNAGDNTSLPPDQQDLDGDGNVTELIPYDLETGPRIEGGVVDLGAFEGGGCASNGECNDNNPCTSDLCSGGVCTNPIAAAGTPCGINANTDCDNPDTCNSSGQCLPNNEPNGLACTSDSNPCTNDTCSAGVCTHPSLPNGTVCNDNLYCNGADTCSNGSCSIHSNAPCQPDTDNNCLDCCNEATDSCTGQCANGSSCNDGLFCNGSDTCSSGSCSIHASAPCQPDGDSSCSDCCNESTDSCTGQCANGSTCEDGLFCNGADTCTSGSCSTHSAPPCQPDNDSSCLDCCNESTDSCSGQCANGSGCNDGLFCNGADSCTSGNCTTHAGNPCPGPDGDGNCSETCNEATDNCTAADTNGASCSDGLFCNGADTCSGGLCTVHVGTPCPAGQTCTESTDQCSGGQSCTNNNQCNDNNPCTSNICSGGFCTYPNLPANTVCGSASDTDCDNPDTCNGSGVCQPNNAANGTACMNDNNACTSDVCSGGVCTHPFVPAGTACGSSSATVCDNPDTCNSAGVCQLNNAANGTACTTDNNPCTSDLCSGGACAHPNAPAGTACGSSSNTICDNPDTCSSAGVCQINNEPNGTPCTSDSNPNTSDICSAGACTHPLICNSNGTCNQGENCDNCPGDCDTFSICGNNICEPTGGEDCLSCLQDCNGVQSGNPNNRYCCGDGEGHTPVGCNDQRCTASGNTCSNFNEGCCGDGVCQPPENATGCGLDCCPSDINQDSTVNASDLSSLLVDWGNPACGGLEPCAADLDSNGVVDAADLSELLVHWGDCQ